MQKYLKFLGLLALAALILWWFGRGLDWAAVKAAIALANWWLILIAVVIVCLTYLVRAFRWQALLRPITPASIEALFAATTVGFGALFLVGRAGEVLRPAFLPLKDPRVRPGAAFVTIGVERIYDLSAVVILFAVNLLWFRPATVDDHVFQRMRMAGVVMLLAVTLGIGILMLFRRRAGPIVAWLDTKLDRLPWFLSRPGRIVTELLLQLSQALGVLTNFRDLAVTVGWTVVTWSSVVAANWLLLLAFGLHMGPGAAIFLLGWALIGSLVPTPGGAAGAFHATTAAGLMSLGVDREKAAAMAIVTHLVVFSPAVFLGLFYFFRSDVSVARLRGLIYPDNEETKLSKRQREERRGQLKIAESKTHTGA